MKNNKNFIEIYGAKTHNLKNLNLKIPAREIIILTGVSGSGKSSLALDTLYAEGQRRYVESFSTYARQFLEKVQKPDVEKIEGLFPAIAISQKPHPPNPRSTVGTITEIYDFLRLLFAKIGKIHCYNCNRIVKKDSINSVFKTLKNELKENEKIGIFFPLFIENDQNYKEVLKKLIRFGYDILLKEDKYYDINEFLEKGYSVENVFVHIDTIEWSLNKESRIKDSLEIAFSQGKGDIMILRDNKERLLFTEKLMCPYCKIFYKEPEPSELSFNSPKGACPKCQGFGNIISIDMKKIIPDENLTLEDKPIACWNSNLFSWFYKKLQRLSSKYKIPWNVPFKDLNSDIKKLIIEGNEDFPGIKGFFEILNEKKYKVQIRVFLSRFRKYEDCPVCKGSKLKREALCIKILNKNIYELCEISAERLRDFINSIELTIQEKDIAEKVLVEIKKRLNYLCDVGLGYLTLNRQASTLSGGEAQRINLAVALGTALTDTLYILDEPSIGLHPSDNQKLLNIIKSIKDLGNTVIIIEHDEEIIKSGDYIIELGPGSGEEGGYVIYCDRKEKFLKNSKSLTSRYLKGELKISCAKIHSSTLGSIKIIGAKEHNLKNIDVEIPLGKFVCLTGVSGSGKSTLAQDVLYAGYKSLTGSWKGKVGSFDKLIINGKLKDIIYVDQLPPSKSPKSIVATYINAFEHIRKIFANTSEAKLNNLTPSSFSFHSNAGRCPYCQGNGFNKIDMLFLASINVECEFCKGKRFKDDILKIKYKGKNIYEVLNLTIDEAIKFFEEDKLKKCLYPLIYIGLGYLRLGQSLDTLSAGEAQRIKIASFISSYSSNILYLFDEPTIGLHFHDINKLMDCFNKLLQNGNSILVIEHNINVIKNADYIIDLGPGGGEFGGYIVAAGKPEEIANNPNSITGKYLKSESNKLYKEKIL